MDVGGANTGNLLQSSCLTEVKSEQIHTNTWDQSGWYYLLITGHNGAHYTAPYSLNVDINSDQVTLPDFQPINFPPLTTTYPGVKTLILTHEGRLAERYPIFYNATDNGGAKSRQSSRRSRTDHRFRQSARSFSG